MITCIETHDSKLTEVQEVKQGIQEHFSELYRNNMENRPIIREVEYKMIDMKDNEALTTEFNMDEIKSSVWDCDNTKSSGPDDLNFGFIMEFSEVIKDYFLRFILEFHSNGRIV